MSIKKMKKKWIVIVVAVVVVMALGVGMIGFATGTQTSNEVQGTVDVITKRSIATSISGNGTVEAATKEDVTGGSYGMTVESVLVKEGDMVSAGDVICVFDTDNWKEQVSNLKQQISDTESDRKEQNADYDKQISDAKNSTKEDLAEARENLKTAKKELETEQTELKALEKQLKKHQANKKEDPCLAPEYCEKCSKIKTDINSQKTTVDSKQSRVDNYEAQIKSLEEQDTSSLEEAKKNYNSQVDDSVDNLQEQVDTYEEQIADATIKANMSGTVTAVHVTENGNFSGGTIASIEAVDAFIIEAQIDEYDIPDIAEGMKVLVKTDATRDLEMEGIVTYVAPRATDSGSSAMGGLGALVGGDTSSFSSGSGSATYLVKIELKEQNERLRLGMNAKVSIITEESVDAWSVPYDAVHTRNDGTTYLEVITGEDEEGKLITKEMNVEIGIQGTYYIEVISDDIKEGTSILIPTAQGSSSISDLLNIMGAEAGI